MQPLEVKWRGNVYTVAASKYVENDNTCLVLLSVEGVLEAKATTNLDKLPPHLVYIKNWSENRGLDEVLIKRGFIHPTGKSVRSGMVEVKQYQLAQDFGEALGILVPAEAPVEPGLDADQTIETPQPPASASEMGLNVPELVEGLEASGLKVHVLETAEDVDNLPTDLLQEKLEEDARDIEAETNATRKPDEPPPSAA